MDETRCMLSDGVFSFGLKVGPVLFTQRKTRAKRRLFQPLKDTLKIPYWKTLIWDNPDPSIKINGQTFNF